MDQWSTFDSDILSGSQFTSFASQIILIQFICFYICTDQETLTVLDTKLHCIAILHDTIIYDSEFIQRIFNQDTYIADFSSYVELCSIFSLLVHVSANSPYDTSNHFSIKNTRREDDVVRVGTIRLWTFIQLQFCVNRWFKLMSKSSESHIFSIKWCWSHIFVGRTTWENSRNISIAIFTFDILQITGNRTMSDSCSMLIIGAATIVR